ncbi:hypothetical protein HK097_008438 [Rhizophlyctis rosea]|uniref:Nucleoporin Nup133/Nup155-like C-terminal domain-containing protein n=1 Tax=Rhizophlyctis rosea TaxID=64517 RepID=A0AAD5X5B6_9FUNG|nr:hypothetical protein HK097_008438 [Rhizophlyctis rosea]
MCLAIASGHGSVKEQYRNEALKQKATHLFQDQGGRPHVTNTQNVGRRTNNMDPGFPLETPDYSFSFKHDGFATYLARLLRPIWRKKMFAAAISRKSKNRDERLKPQKSKEVGQKQLDYVKGNLLGLNECLTGRLHRFTAAPSPEMHVPQYVDGAAWKNEQESLYRLHQLLKMALEGIHFVQLLLDYKVGDLVKQWEGAKRTAAYNTDFASLITSDDGRNLCKDLMSALVEKQISDQSGVNIVNDKLRQQCPSICRDNDAAYYKGIELLRTATMQHPGPQQDEQVLEAFGIFKDIAENITSDQLSKIFSMFKSMKYYRGCIDLVLIWANAIDPDNEAQNGGQMGMFPDSDPRSGVIRPVLQAREGAYNLVTELIDSLWLEKDSARSTSRGTTSIDNIIKGVLQQIVFAKDDMFHSTVYNWLAEKGKLRLLFEYDNEDLQRYLKSTSEAKPQNAELYAQYLVQHGKHLRAAEVLHELTNYNGLSLEERMRYLLKAQTEAGTASALGQIRNTRDEDLLVTIREAFEIAGIQLELFQKLKELPDTPEDTLAQLNGELMNLTVMYQRFAKPKKLYDMMLLIFGTADWSDSMAPRIQATWADILREAKETVPEGGVYTAFDAQKSKLKELGQRFHTNKNIFPVSEYFESVGRDGRRQRTSSEANEISGAEYLVDTLEHECFEAAETEGATKAPEGWVVDTMREIGVPFSELFDVLCGLFDAKLPPWSSTKALTFLVNDGCGLLERWLREVKLRTRSVERDPFLPRTVDDAVVRWLATINGNEFPELEKRLHAISEEMHRMV